MEGIKQEAIKLMDQVYMSVMKLAKMNDPSLFYASRIKQEQDILDKVQEVLDKIDEIQNQIENL